LSDRSRQGRGLLGRLKGALGESPPASAPERRASKRVKLPIPVQLEIEGGEPMERRLRDISQQGLCIEAIDGGRPGQTVTVRFQGYPDVCDPFVLSGAIVRIGDEQPPALVINIDRQRTPPEALNQYRALVLHYIRHKPLLDELGRGYFEGHCVSCDWIGRVGARKPTCARCGDTVVPVGLER